MEDTEGCTKVYFNALINLQDLLLTWKDVIRFNQKDYVELFTQFEILWVNK